VLLKAHATGLATGKNTNLLGMLDENIDLQYKWLWSSR